MAATRLFGNGWTAMSLIPRVAQANAAGVNFGSRITSQANRANQTAAGVRQDLMDKVMGKQKPTPTPAPAKQPDQNPAVNSFSTTGFQFTPVTGV
jgi:hypothetical protein